MHDFDPTRAAARITLSSYDEPMETMREALLNPGSLPLDIEVDVGELHPVGASHTTLQYGSTRAVQTSLELYFSSSLQGRYIETQGDAILVQQEPIDITKHVNWLASFCYAAEEQRAPSPLVISWPNVVHIVCVVRRFNANYIRFASDLTPLVAQVNIECVELRRDFKTSAAQRQLGFHTFTKMK
jgi:hypothetical protein